jgi:hypothetical protein
LYGKEARHVSRTIAEASPVLSGPLAIAVVAGAVFAPIGGLTAGIITYIEYVKHPLPKGSALKEAIRSGIVAVIVLIALAAVFGLFMGGR